MKARILILAALLLAAGCSSPSATPTQGSATPTQGEETKQEKKQNQEAVANNQQSVNQPTTQETQPTTQQAQPSQTKPVQSKPKPAVAVIPVVVNRVIDGDTFETTINGKTERVRMIGVDTPEVHGKVEAYGKEASNYTKSQLTGKTVYLEKDVQERDKYGRLLAYVWLSQPTTIDDKTIRSQMFNAKLLLGGYANTMTIAPNVKYADKFRVYEREARTAKRGLWAIETTQQTVSSKATSSTSKKSSSANKPRSVKGTGGYDCPPGYPVKGNINSKGEKIYHVPGGQFYDRTKPEYCFCTPADAEAAGFRASKR